MAKYKKRADGRYATSIIVGYKDDGKPKRKIIYGRTIMELEKKVADVKSLQNKGIVIDDEGLTVEQWSRTWLELYKANKAYNTYMMYKRTVENHIIPYLGSMRLSALKKHHIQKMLNDIIGSGHQRTAELARLTIRQIIDHAIENEYIYKDVSARLSMPEKKKPDKRALTASELKLIQKADLSPKERAYIDLLYYTGLRRGEALALMISDLDFVNRKVNVNKNLIIKDTGSEVKHSPKSKAGFREVPMPDPLLSSLQKYLPEVSSVYLFTSENGNLTSKSSFRRFWDNIMDKLNIAAGGKKYARKELHKDEDKPAIRLISKDITPHIFRHTYATNLYYAGVDIKTAQYLLGHSDIKMTLEIYTHLDNGKVEETGNKLNDYFINKNNGSDSQNIVSSQN